MMGAGDYARGVLLPQFKANGVDFVAITTASGVTARDVGARHGFAQVVSGADEVLANSEVNLVVIATRHDSHAKLAQSALQRGLNVFVEKPLALDPERLDAVLETARGSTGKLMVGFNRRFSTVSRAA